MDGSSNTPRPADYFSRESTMGCHALRLHPGQEMKASLASFMEKRRIKVRHVPSPRSDVCACRWTLSRSAQELQVSTANKIFERRMPSTSSKFGYDVFYMLLGWVRSCCSGSALVLPAFTRRVADDAGCHTRHVAISRERDAERSHVLRGISVVSCARAQ